MFIVVGMSEFLIFESRVFSCCYTDCYSFISVRFIEITKVMLM